MLQPQKNIEIVESYVNEASPGAKQGINQTKNLQALIFARTPLETLPTKRKIKFDSGDNDSKSNCNNSSDVNNDNKNEQEYSYNNDNNDHDDKNNCNKKFFDNDNNDKSYD